MLDIDTGTLSEDEEPPDLRRRNRVLVVDEAPVFEIDDAVRSDRNVADAFSSAVVRSDARPDTGADAAAVADALSSAVVRPDTGADAAALW